MSFSKSSAVCLAVLCMLGCADPPPPKKTVFDPLTVDLDRARDVQKTVDRNTEGTRAAVDAQERGDGQEHGGGQEPGQAQERGDGRP